MSTQEGDRPVVLVADDDDDIRDLVAFRLDRAGYEVLRAGDGEQALELAKQHRPDLAVLDVMMPKLTGYDVTRELRASAETSRIPVILLTARVQEADVARGFEAGADDYVKKPFSMAELLARIEALLRRAPTRASAPGAVYQFGGVRVDLRGTEVMRDGKRIELSAREFQLLRFFIEHAGATLSREDLLTQVWGYSATMFTRTVDVHVASLRQKLEAEPKQPQFLLTVQGLGYKFKRPW